MAKVNPVNGPTLIVELSRLVPLRVNEFAAEVVVIHWLPKAVKEPAVTAGVPLDVIVKVWALDAVVLPVLSTVTLAVPCAAISPAAMVAVSCVALTKVVVRALPSHCTVETPLMKLVPFTVSVKPAPPSVAEDGEMEVVVGVGGIPQSEMDAPMFVLVLQVPVTLVRRLFPSVRNSTRLMVMELGTGKLKAPDVKAVDPATTKVPPLVASKARTTYLLDSGTLGEAQATTVPDNVYGLAGTAVAAGSAAVR